MVGSISFDGTWDQKIRWFIKAGDNRELKIKIIQA